MANQKISELTEKQNPALDDILPVVDTAVSPITTKRVTVGSLTDLFNAEKIGATGPAGPTGAQGDVGETGPTGPAPTVTAHETDADKIYVGGVLVSAAQGATGPTGEAGPVGAEGPVGATGVTGAVGAQGPVGATGVTGPAPTVTAHETDADKVYIGGVEILAIQGATGPAGADGADGAVGPQGATGLTGDTGPQGAQGDTGATGPAGPAGSSNLIEFVISFNGSTPNTVSSLPAGWSASINGSVVTVNHTVGYAIRDVTYWGYRSATDTWHARYPSAINELKIPDSSGSPSTSSFSITVSNTVVGCDSSGTARIVCFF